MRGGIGMHPKASNNETDAYDAEQVPLLSGFNMPELLFSTGNKTILNKEIIPTQKNYTWNLTVNPSGEGGASLSWPAFETAPDRKLVLLDLATMRIVDMHSQQEISLGKESKALKILFGDEQYIQAALDTELPAIGQPYPNPAREVVRIPFYVTESATQTNVKIEVYNNLGVKITTLVNAQFSAGNHELIWKSEVPKGLYFISMLVGNSEKRVKVIIQ
jgi:hypothetical protein